MQQLNLLATDYFNPVNKDELQIANLCMARNHQKIKIEYIPNLSKDGHYIAVRGGYEAISKIGDVSNNAIKNIRSITGYSDMTTVLLWLLKKRIPCIMGPMILSDFAEKDIICEQTISSLLACLDSIERGVMYNQHWESTEVLSWSDWLDPIRWTSERETAIVSRVTSTRRAFSLSGISLGGNMTLFMRQLHTRFFPDYLLDENNILFFEDVEIGDSFDIKNYLYYLYYKGVLRNTQLIIFGIFQKKESTTLLLVDELLEDLDKTFGIPIVYNCPIGHIQPLYSVLLGASTTTNFNSRGLDISQEITL